MRKEGNACAYLNSFKVRLSQILLYWFCLHRNRKYLSLTCVLLSLLCPYDVIHESITLLLALNASSQLQMESSPQNYLSDCNSHKTWCISAQTTTFQKVSNGEDKKTIKRLNFYEKIYFINQYSEDLVLLLIFECMCMWRGYACVPLVCKC